MGIAPSQHAGKTSAITENTPLLASAADDPPLPINEGEVIRHESLGEHADGPDHVDNAPLPKFQIFLLCFARLIEPIAFFGIFPFINKMILETGDLEEADVGFYSGFIVCLFLTVSIIKLVELEMESANAGDRRVCSLSRR